MTAVLGQAARLFEAPLLRVLDERGRHDVAATGRLRRGDEGHVLYCEGEADGARAPSASRRPACSRCR